MTSIGQQKRRLIERLGRVALGTFTEDDIRLLLISLRERCHGERVLREIADFVAHPERNKGITTDSLREMYLSMRWFREYVAPKRTLDLFAPFPRWVRDLVLYRSHAPNTQLQVKFGLSPKAFRELEKANYVAMNSGEGRYASSSASSNLAPALAELLQVIHVRPAYSQGEFLQAFGNVVRRNTLIPDDQVESIARERGNALTAATLCVLHGSAIDLDGARGLCSIGVDPESGNVQLMGTVAHSGGPSWVFGVMATELRGDVTLTGNPESNRGEVTLTSEYKLHLS